MQDETGSKRRSFKVQVKNRNLGWGRKDKEKSRDGWMTWSQLSECGGRNVWNPNCVIATEQTLVLPVTLQTEAHVCERQEEQRTE